MQLLLHFINTQFILHRHNIWNLFPALYKNIYIYSLSIHFQNCLSYLGLLCMYTNVHKFRVRTFLSFFLFLIEDPPRMKNTVKTVILYY